MGKKARVIAIMLNVLVNLPEYRGRDARYPPRLNFWIHENNLTPRLRLAKVTIDIGATDRNRFALLEHLPDLVPRFSDNVEPPTPRRKDGHRVTRVEQRLRELDQLGEDLTVIDRGLGQAVLQDTQLKRLLTITGVNATVAIGILAAIGDISRFVTPQKLVSYFGLNPRVHQSGLQPAQHGHISNIGRAHARGMLVEAAWAAAKAPGPLVPPFCASVLDAVCKSLQWRPLANWPRLSGTCSPIRKTSRGRDLR